MNDTVWFRRFGDIPGNNYIAPSGLDLRHLPQRHATPEQHRYGASTSLWWETEHGGTSASPAHEHQQQIEQHWSAAQICTNIAEVLELPGTPSDYHFALQSAAGSLYTRRTSNPAAIDDAERLYLLDLDLIQAYPAAVALDDVPGRAYVTITGIGRLLRLYLTEGRVADAASIADIAERFGVGDARDAISARQRAAALAKEDA